MDFRAVDVGYGWVKALRENCRKKFAAVIGDFVPVKYSPGMNNESPELQIAINHDEFGKYYIGEAAQRQSTALATMEKDRIINKEGELLLLSALGLMQQYKTESIKLVVGLPVLYYNEKRKSAYQKMANGEHQFQFLRPDGGILDYCNFTVEETKVLPQPMGTIFSQLVNDKGDIIDENIAAGKIGAIVIGYNTLEIARCDNLDYVESKSTSFPKYGMYSIYESLHNEISRELEINIPIEEIEPYIMKNSIKVRGKEISIVDIKKKTFMGAQDKIMSVILNLWDDITLMDKIYIAGGVAEVIGASMQKRFGDYSMVVKDPVWSVVDGYGKYAKWFWRR